MSWNVAAASLAPQFKEQKIKPVNTVINDRKAQVSRIYLSCGIFTRQCTDEELQGLRYKVKFAETTFPSVTCGQSDIGPAGGKER